MTGVWAAADVITAARANEKTVFQGTGAAISGLTTYAGQVVFCTSTGSGFTINNGYVRNAQNTGWLAMNNSVHLSLLSLTAGATDATLTAATVRGFGNIVGAGNALIGRTVQKVTIYLKSSMVGTGTVGIWDSSDVLQLTLGTIDCSTLTASYAAYSFENLTGRVIATSDRIGISISGANTTTVIRRNAVSVESNMGGAGISDAGVWAAADADKDMDMIVYGN